MAAPNNFTLDANCQLAWIFDQGTGTTVADRSGKSRTGTFKGSGEPAWGSTSPPANYIAYVDYDSVDDYISLPDTTDLDIIGNTDATIYFAIDFNTTDDYERFLVKQIGTTGDGWFLVRNGTQFAFAKEVSGTQTGVNLFSIPSSGTFHEFFVQYDYSTNQAREYIDKSAGGWAGITSGFGFGWSADGKLYLGGRGDISASQGSKIAAFAIWDRLLSTDEMDEISDNGLLYEDLTTYTEVDQNSDLTVTTKQVAFNTIKTRDALSYVYKDVPMYGDFEVDFKTNLSATNTFSGELYVWACAEE